MYAVALEHVRAALTLVSLSHRERDGVREVSEKCRAAITREERSQQPVVFVQSGAAGRTSV